MRVLLDTCVLYPAKLRDLLLGLAARGLFTPLWSHGIAAEWLHLVARRNPAEHPLVAGLLTKMSARWPEGRVSAGAPEALDLPDAADRHVLAAAIAGDAALILTDNWRDFPVWALDPHGMKAVTPDNFVMQLWLDAPDAVASEVAALWPGMAGAELRKALRKAGLPRLGKALEH
ncbi:PIN domain-containing protein [Pararhodobacter sp. SW119]|uniref:RSP_2648 family PIN domain-containing protein n=1 Tax=Pararhodobacter sp. SW119 TaxID=2780075 RepID=UPI001ADED535|nr:PIN domain-containing protein [Pararhodobacter sp. SW119]